MLILFAKIYARNFHATIFVSINKNVSQEYVCADRNQSVLKHHTLLNGCLLLTVIAQQCMGA